MADCIFCKIVKGEVPCYKIYEDENFLAFLDTLPVNPGHSLVISKKHYEDILDAPQDVLCEMIKVVQKISKTVIKIVNSPGFNIGINNKKVSGQGIFHIHIHIMPRFENDGYKLWPGKKRPEKEMQEMADKIANSL